MYGVEIFVGPVRCIFSLSLIGFVGGDFCHFFMFPLASVIYSTAKKHEMERKVYAGECHVTFCF